MATVREEFVRLQWLIAHGRGEEKCHIVLIDEEAKVRIANQGPKPRTRFIMETDCPQAYSDLNAEKDRWLRVIGNKSVCVSLMIQAWQRYTIEELRLAAEGMEEIGAVESPVPRAVIPKMA